VLDHVGHAAESRRAIGAAGAQEVDDLASLQLARPVDSLRRFFAYQPSSTEPDRNWRLPSSAIAFSWKARPRGVWQAPQWARPSTSSAPRCWPASSAGSGLKLRGRANSSCHQASGQRMLAGHGIVLAALSCFTGCTEPMK
jgi:hypothetical protein